MTEMNDARLWAQIMGHLRTNGISDTAAADRLARELVAIVRRERGELPTWGPGATLPSPPPPAVADVDGAVWFEQRDSGRGCYRMSAADRAKYEASADDVDDSTDDVDGVRPWPFLLDSEGPVTRHPAPTESEFETLRVLFGRYLSTDLAEAIED
ncbi:hypothetical protein, partial [Saccharopolyspora taberi]